MKTKRILLFAPLLLGCTTGRVSTTASKDVNLSGFKTYAYLTPDVEVGNYPALSSDVLKKDIQQAIETQLTQRGLTRNDANPDVLVGYHVYTKDQSQLVTTSTTPAYPYAPLMFAGGFRRGWGYYPYGYQNWPYQYNSSVTTEQNMTDGTLVIDLVLPKDKTVAWRGADDAPINPKDAQSVDADAVRGVQQIFKKYPVPVATSSR